jgi:hypothetical protein
LQNHLIAQGRHLNPLIPTNTTSTPKKPSDLRELLVWRYPSTLSVEQRIDATTFVSFAAESKLAWTNTTGILVKQAANGPTLLSMATNFNLLSFPMDQPTIGALSLMFLQCLIQEKIPFIC